MFPSRMTMMLRESRFVYPPDVADDQCVENVAVAIQNVQSEGAASLRVLVDVVLHQFHTLHRVHDAELVHYFVRGEERLLICSLPLSSWLP